MAGWMSRKGRTRAGSPLEEGEERKKPRLKWEGDPGASTFLDQVEEEEENEEPVQDSGGDAEEMTREPGAGITRCQGDREI